ncbi:hypothetical protein SAMN04488515_1513 [Cognatiyoonia koreensis]|uniref:Uncharacterized protein n=1 Tax=Cognatiyoonia koreensis TaxID=364200 RepID=A0A1I0PXC5_9RHOB|nr:hypothetical protein [Cognatiyoonia koreensis]SEW19258.1 hypothetical protein SAMN04488515_1513 [Cognatiyoonia koreensis]
MPTGDQTREQEQTVTLRTLRETRLLFREATKDEGEILDFIVDIVTSRISMIFASVSTDRGKIPMLIDTRCAKLEGAQVLVDRSKDGAIREIEKSDQAVDVSALPPLITGPFGNTVSLALMGALLNESLFDSDAVERPDGAVDSKGRFWASQLQDVPVFNSIKELGRWHDIVVKCSDMACQNIILRTDEDEQVIPFDIRNIPKKADNIIVSDSVPAPWSVEAIINSAG